MSKISFLIIPALLVVFELLFQTLMLNQHSLEFQEKVSVSKHIILKVMKKFLSGKGFFQNPYSIISNSIPHLATKGCHYMLQYIFSKQNTI